MSEAAKLKVFVAERGYIKSGITRMHIFCLDEEAVKMSSSEALAEKRYRLSESFKDYERLNKAILSLNSSDDEKYDEYEDKYYEAIGILDKHKAAVVHNVPNNGAHGKFNNLPKIQMQSFNGEKIADYYPFINMFKSVIHIDNNLSACEKLYYLRSYLSDEALNLIKNLTLTDENYVTALSLLENRYDNVPKIVNYHVNSLLDMPSFSKCTAKNLRSLIGNFNLHLAALKSLKQAVQHWDILLINILAKKVDVYTYRGFYLERNTKELPTLSQFIDFLEKRALAMENTAEETQEPPPTNRSSKPIKSVSGAATAKSQQSCKYCQQNHRLFQCAKFKMCTVQERSDFVKNKNLCTLCLNEHKGRCMLRLKCTVCHKRHNSLLHDQSKSSEESQHAATVAAATNQGDSVVSMSGTSTSLDVLLPTAIVRLKNKDGTFSSVRALLDSGSQVSFITEKLTQKSCCEILPTNQTITGVVEGANKVTQKANCTVFSSVNNYKTNVSCCIVKNITCNLPQQTFDISNYNIPAHIKLADNNFNKSGEISLLLGCDIFFQVLQRESLPITPAGPYLINTCFGYVAAGSLPVSAGKVFSCNLCINIQGNPGNFLNTPKQKAQLCDLNNTFSDRFMSEKVPYVPTSKQDVKLCHSTNAISDCLESENAPNVINTEVSPVIVPPKQEPQLCELNNTISYFWQCEKVPSVFKEGSTEHQLAEECFQGSVKLINKRFSVALPLKLDLENVQLGNSFSYALQRLYNLEKRFLKDEALSQQYKKFIQEYLNQGHAISYNIDNYDLSAGNIYFLPHHPVINPNSKTTPVRAVFDASMRTKNGLCLNDIMLNGGVVQSELFDILILLRTYRYILLCDIKAMYRQILVEDKFRCLQNILWRNSSSDPVQCIQLKTVTYGLKSSAFLATRCLIELANIFESKYPLAAFVLKHSSYVDDIQCGSNSISELFCIKKELIELMSEASFALHKWYSNDLEILKDIPVELQYFGNRELDKNNICMKTLGLSLDVSSDSLTMQCPEKELLERYTKRNMLSFISQIFDPLGILGPVLVQAKILMQKVWFLNLNWDDYLPEPLHTQWIEFARRLVEMKAISVPRNINMLAVNSIELVGYADASNVAYGCCLYLRIMDNHKTVKVNLLCSKSRINPKAKQLTTPRLELNSALLLSMLAKKVHDILCLKYNVKTFLYMDSQIVLAWLKIQPEKLSVYVANRVKQIQKLTSEFHWFYVQTSDNPADCLSRGISPQALEEKVGQLWFHGPQFLHCTSYIHCNAKNRNTDFDIPEQRPEQKTCNLCKIENSFYGLFAKYSNFEKIIRIMSYVQRFIHNSKKENSHLGLHGNLWPKELNSALQTIIKLDQKRHFQEELKILKSHGTLKCHLKSLNPFIDSLGLMRVGGRLQNSNLPFNQQHPIILPKKSNITRMIILKEHLRLKHAGQKLVLSTLNERYWLINANREIKAVLHKCLICFKLKARAATQLMGSLPLDRVKMSRPFQIVGTDYAGPFYVKQTRIRKPVITKAYIVIFICFTTKAIHIELASDMTTNTFLGCLKRFIARRNKPTKIYCDNGTYFKGANNVLKELYHMQNSTDHQNAVNNFCNEERISFHFIPSYSPVFGGLWEAGIKSIKYHVKRVVSDTVLTYEELYTVLVQIESILNSRPLTPMSRDENDMSYLSPAHFLTGSSLMSYPELNLVEANVGKLSFWKKCTQMQQHFWQQWHKQYLTTLQNRPKWTNSQVDLKEGMMVILRNKNVSPLKWPVGRIVSVLPGKDGKVRALNVKTVTGSIMQTSIMNVCPLPLCD